jgi:small subunit ribosomal protein S6
MRPYEAMVILDPTLSDEDMKANVARISSLVTDQAKGKVLKVDEWGKRKLAYEIKKRGEGYYAIYRFDADPDAIAEFERTLKISDPVLRFLVVRLDESTEA